MAAKTVNIPVGASGQLARHPSLGLIEVTLEGALVGSDFPRDVSQRIVALIRGGRRRGSIRVRGTRYAWVA